MSITRADDPKRQALASRGDPADDLPPIEPIEPIEPVETAPPEIAKVGTTDAPGG